MGKDKVWRLRLPLQRQENVTSGYLHRRRGRSHRRRAAVAALEVVLATAVALPLAVMMFLLGVQICRYVFRGLDGMLTMPWL